jgi:hypothetical protein
LLLFPAFIMMMVRRRETVSLNLGTWKGEVQEKRTKLAGLFVLAPATSIRTSGAHNPQDRMNP